MLQQYIIVIVSFVFDICIISFLYVCYYSLLQLTVYVNIATGCFRVL